MAARRSLLCGPTDVGWRRTSVLTVDLMAAATSGRGIPSLTISRHPPTPVTTRTRSRRALSAPRSCAPSASWRHAMAARRLRPGGLYIWPRSTRSPRRFVPRGGSRICGPFADVAQLVEHSTRKRIGVSTASPTRCAYCTRPASRSLAAPSRSACPRRAARRRAAARARTARSAPGARHRGSPTAVASPDGS